MCKLFITNFALNHLWINTIMTLEELDFDDEPLMDETNPND